MGIIPVFLLGLTIWIICGAVSTWIPNLIHEIRRRQILNSFESKQDVEEDTSYRPENEWRMR